MNRLSAYLLAAFVAMTASAATPTDREELAGIGRRLCDTGCYSDSCLYEVLLPSASDPVVYSVSLLSGSAPGDTLSPCDYYIRWRLEGRSTASSGFSAYFAGSHFRFRDARLQEYHLEENPAVFAPSGHVGRGVQRQVQFASLLPQFLGTELLRVAADPECDFTIRHANGRVGIRGTQRANGYDVLQFSYVLDANTLLPVQTDLDNNPGQISEQNVTVKYTAAATPPNCALNLERLIGMEPEAFEKFRTGTFSLEALAGKYLPDIALKDTQGRRWTHTAGEPLHSPAVIAFLSTQVGSTPEVMDAVRSALSALPFVTDIIWIFLEHPDAVEALGVETHDGERLLVNGGSAARDCGIGAITPVLVFVGANGKVADFERGVNKDLPAVVMEKTAVAASLR